MSLVETGRVNGKVRHEHIASLGSILMPPTVASRIIFWCQLHERLARLSNRIDGEAQGKILGAVHERIPMVTPDEQRALQLENAKADAEQWSNIHNLHAGTVEEHKGFAAKVATPSPVPSATQSKWQPKPRKRKSGSNGSSAVRTWKAVCRTRSARGHRGHPGQGRMDPRGPAPRRRDSRVV